MASVSLSSSAGKWVMTSSILASSMAFIDSTALNVVLPSLQQELDASASSLFWVLNSYLLMLASLILTGGSLGDKLGRKKVFLTGIVIFMIGSLACGMAPDVRLLIIFRGVQGLGGALMIPGSLSLISASFNKEERGKAIGTWSAITTMVTIGGPVLGGALGDAGLWRFIFFINIPIGIVSVIVLWLKVRESRDEHLNKRIDYPGALTTVPGLALLTFGFLSIPETGIYDVTTILSLAGGLLLLGLFIVIEKRSKNPMLPLNLFSNKIFSGVNLLTFFLYAALTAGMLFLGLNMIQIQGYSQLQAGLTLLPFSLLMVTLARYSGTLADKYGPRWLLVAGPATAGLGFLLLAFVKNTDGPSEYWTTYFPGILVFGLGMSITVAPLTSTVMGSVANHFAGTASGVNNAITRISGVFANAILGALALLMFSSYLENEIKSLPLSPGVRHSVMAEAGNLGNAQVPAGVSDSQRRIIEKTYTEGFIASYSMVMLICAALAFLGSIMSFLLVENEVSHHTDKLTAIDGVT